LADTPVVFGRFPLYTGWNLYSRRRVVRGVTGRGEGVGGVWVFREARVKLLRRAGVSLSQIFNHEIVVHYECSNLPESLAAELHIQCYPGVFCGLSMKSGRSVFYERLPDTGICQWIEQRGESL